MQFDLREFTDRLCRFRSTAGREAVAAEWVRERLDALGFETYAWDADAELLAGHPSFPDDPAAIDVDGRRSVAGVLELGPAGADAPSASDDPAVGDASTTEPDHPTVVLNGHLDVVPAEADSWSSDPFEPTRRGGEKTASGSDDGETLTARGAADMKSGLAACVGAALDVRDAVADGALATDGAVAADESPGVRVVVEAVAGEEDGGYGAATAALSNPYPFDRDAAIVAEPTDLRPVVATEGSLMVRLELTGRSAHAATPWHGEDVLPRFERIRRAFADLETERGERVTHPLYDAFPVPWPVVCGTVEAGSWTSTVPASLTATFRIGVAPGETVRSVESTFADRLAEVVDADPWLRAHPPTFERVSVQFEPAEIAPDEPIVEAVRAGLDATGLPDAEPEGATYGADSRHYVAAGVPTVVFGPGSIAEAHYPDETVVWSAVEHARSAIAAATLRYARDHRRTTSG
ncbi:ArgE/DapE family deacylase [Halorubrum luteum]